MLSEVIARYSQRTPVGRNLNIWPSVVNHRYPSKFETELVRLRRVCPSLRLVETVSNSSLSRPEERESYIPKTQKMLEQMRRVKAILGERLERMEKENKEGLDSVKSDTQNVNAKVEDFCRKMEENRKKPMSHSHGHNERLERQQWHGRNERLERHKRLRRVKEDSRRKDLDNGSRNSRYHKALTLYHTGGVRSPSYKGGITIEEKSKEREEDKPRKDKSPKK
ncbi:hypothetical protein CR513_28016, partial [Mucuna pruriens]